MAAAATTGPIYGESCGGKHAETRNQPDESVATESQRPRDGSEGLTRIIFVILQEVSGDVGQQSGDTVDEKTTSEMESGQEHEGRSQVFTGSLPLLLLSNQAPSPCPVL